MCISSNQSFNTHRQCMLLKVWNVSVWKTYAFVENAIRDQTVFEATSQKNSEWICEHINQYFHQLWNITMEQFITLCGRKELYVFCFYSHFWEDMLESNSPCPYPFKTNQTQRGHKIQTCLSESPFRQQVLY